MDNQNQNFQQNTTEPKVSAGVPLKTVVLIVILALVAISLVYVAFLSKDAPLKQIVQKTQQQQEESLSDTSLSIDKSVKDEQNNEYYSIVNIDSGKNSIVGVQLELYYDPSLITNVTVTPLDFFPQAVEVLKKVDDKNGRISYAITVSPGETAVIGKGQLVKINYTPIGNNGISGVINFLPKTEVSGEATAGSLLKSTSDGEINIEANNSVTVQNSPTPTVQ